MRTTERIKAIREIVENKRAAEIEGVPIDPDTAKAVVLVHDALTRKHRAEFASMSISNMASIALILANKYGSKHAT